MRQLLLLCLLWIPQQVQAAEADVEADVIVELRTEGSDLRVLATTAITGSRALGAKNVSGLSHFPLLHLQIPADRLPQLTALPQVRAVYPNHRVTAARTEGGALIGSPQLRSKYRASGKGIGVAVFDTGVDSSHPELADHVVAGFDFIGNEPFADRNGHGTAVAGIVHGMAPDAHLFSFKVLDDEGNGTEWSVLEGLNAVYANRTAFGGIHVVTASIVYGGPANEDCDEVIPERPAFDLLEQAGVVVVFAAGNEGFRDGISEFACHSKVISAGAVYDADIGPSHHGSCDDPTTRAGQIACYSNSGNPLDVRAPAEVARTTASGGGYTGFGGTSAATPYVAGVIAQLRSKFPKATPAKIRSVLMSTGTPLTDTNGITRRLISGPAAYKKLKKAR
ncbi:MAG TPA: S8 family serine peptidase [Thermoanaerobaculia bacterium]|jgi:subtilisin family serine protease|nr:S8 family serine peptidase [Thermoanaerobaculia bacterium]